MNLSSLITDNIAEILVKIIEFTHARQKVLTQNINNLNRAGFAPKDLEADEFSKLLSNAVNEHIHSRRLVFCDTENIKFGINRSFEAKPVADKYAKELLEEKPDKYLQLQISKLLENSLNQTVAAELLRQRKRMVPMFG